MSAISKYGNSMTVKISDGQNELLGPSKEIDFGRLPFPFTVEGILQSDVSLSFKQDVAPSNLGDVLVKGVGNLASSVVGVLASTNPATAVAGAASKVESIGNTLNAKGLLSSLDSESALNSALKFAGIQYAQTGGLTRQYPVKTSTSIPPVKLKWYMPYGELEVIKSMLILISAIYPTDAAGHLSRMTDNSSKASSILRGYNASYKDTSTPSGYGIKTADTNAVSQALQMAMHAILDNGVVTDVTTGMASMSSPVLKVDIAGWMAFSPVYLTTLKFSLSRNTYDRIYGTTRWTFPVTISAELGFGWAMTPVVGAKKNAYNSGAEALSIFGNILAGQETSTMVGPNGDARGWGHNFNISDLINIMQAMDE